jgi:hypothetical protein
MVKESCGTSCIRTVVVLFGRSETLRLGGAFFDKKVTTGTTIFGFYNEREDYQNGLYTTPTRPAPSNTEGFKFGFGIKFLLGADWEIKIKRNR